MDIESILFNSLPGTPPTPRQGDLLVAEPLLQDVYFHRSVILLLDSDSKGGEMGLVLNRSTTLTLHDLMPSWDKGKRIPVFSGGPVETDRLFMLHSLGDSLGMSMEVLPGLYVGADIERIVDYIDSGKPVDGKMRFFMGYSGWQKDQLTSELIQNVWARVRPPEKAEELLRGSDNDYWRREVSRLGDTYRSWLVVPHDPGLN